MKVLSDHNYCKWIQHEMKRVQECHCTLYLSETDTKTSCRVRRDRAHCGMTMTVYYCAKGYFELNPRRGSQNKKHFCVLRRLMWRHALRGNATIATAPSWLSKVTCNTVGKVILSLKMNVSGNKIKFRKMNNKFYLYILQLLQKSPLQKGYLLTIWIWFKNCSPSYCK